MFHKTPCILNNKDSVLILRNFLRATNSTTYFVNNVYRLKLAKAWNELMVYLRKAAKTIYTIGLEMVPNTPRSGIYEPSDLTFSASQLYNDHF